MWCCCSGQCYYQTIVTPVTTMPDSSPSFSRLPHTVTLVSIPASADAGGNGRRGRGISVSIDQPISSPPNGYSPEHTQPTVRVSQ